MKKSSFVALSIVCASTVALGGEGPKLPNGASPACLADLNVREALKALGDDKVTAGGTAPDGTPMLPSMPSVPAVCRHVIKDVMECALGDGQSVMDQENGEVYTGQVGLAEEWENMSLSAQERRWVSACMIQRLNYFGISVPVLLEGDEEGIEIDQGLSQDYPFAESTAWGDIFTGNEGKIAWICTEEDVWSICPRDLGEPWMDTRVCDGAQNCGIAFAGRCEDACVLTAGGYWDCSAQYGFSETVRVRMQTNTHPPVLGMCQ